MQHSYPDVVRRCCWTMSLPGQSLQPGAWLQPERPLDDSVDCVAFLPNDRLAAKSCDGHICVWSFLEEQQQRGGESDVVDAPCTSSSGIDRFGPMRLMASMRAHEGRTSASSMGRIQFSATPDGAFLVAGSDCGSINVYDAQVGRREGDGFILNSASHSDICFRRQDP